MATRVPEIEQELESRVAEMAMEVVEVEWAGSRRRPILRIRIDRVDRIDHVDSVPGSEVTVDDCVRVSRELEGWLDEHPALSERYVLEVSSPGVERPLNRRRDFVRFEGKEISVKAREEIDGVGSKRAHGVLLGVEDAGDTYQVVLRLENGSTASIDRSEIVRANLVFRWGDD